MTAALLAAVLLAQTAPAPPPVPPPASPAPEDADALVEQAARQYDQDLLAEALQTLERAYAASPRPAILFNMAQVQRAKGDCAAARASYARFIADTAPGDPNRDRAERRQAEMQACVDHQAASAPAVVAAPRAPLALRSPPVAPPAIVRTSTPPESLPPPQTWRAKARAAAWALAGMGTLAAGTAALLAWDAASKSSQLETYTRAHPMFDVTARGLYDDGMRDARWARWLGIGAAVAGGSAVTLFIVTRRPAEAGLPAPRRQTAALVGWSTDF